MHNGSWDNNPSYYLEENFCSNIWSEYNDTTELEGIIHDQMNSDPTTFEIEDKDGFVFLSDEYSKMVIKLPVLF